MGSHASGARRDDARILTALRRIVRLLRLGGRRAEATTGLSSAQLFVLEQLRERAAGSIQEIAARTLTDASSVSIVVSRLEKGRLVRRQRSSEDGRRFVIEITQRGRAALAAGPELAQVRLLRAIASLAGPDRRRLAVLLERVALDAGGPSLAPRMFFEDDPRAPRRPERSR